MEVLFTGRAVIAVGLAAFAMVLVVVSAIRKGKVTLRYGLVIDRRLGPVEFWIGIAVLSAAAFAVVGSFVFFLMGWLRGGH